MSLRLSAHCSERIVLELAEALGWGSDIDSGELASSREQAFSARTAEAFAYHYLRAECFSKWECNSTVDLDRVALMSFFETERQMGVVNQWLRSPMLPWVLDTKRLRKARGIIQRILGRFDVDELAQSCDWSSGATTEFKRSVSQIETKWVEATHLTAGTEPYYRAFHNWAPWPETRREPTLVAGNKVTTVPKSYKTNRVIAIEPSWSMFFQKGIGRMIRKRLRRFGQLHPDAQQRARGLARTGSSTGLLATLDLSSASDCLSLALCEILLPLDWFQHMMNVRSQVGEWDGGVFPYRKISSMGNGFTFELETLIFYALACTHAGLGNKFTHVYGDDIIVPSDLAEPLTETLAETGFALNSDKSFHVGPFRESCGGHYWNGRDVTPFYLKRYPASVGDAIILHNKILRWCSDQGWVTADEFDKPLQTIRKLVPRKFWGPVGVDGALWTHWDRARPKWSSRYQCFTGYRLSQVTKRGDPSMKWELGSYLQALWKGRCGDTEHEESPNLVGLHTWRTSRYYIERTRWLDPTV